MNMEKTYFTQEQLDYLETIVGKTILEDFQAGDEVIEWETEPEEFDNDMFFFYCRSYFVQPSDKQPGCVVAYEVVSTYSINCDGDLIDEEFEFIGIIKPNGEVIALEK